MERYRLALPLMLLILFVTGCVTYKSTTRETERAAEIPSLTARLTELAAETPSPMATPTEVVTQTPSVTPAPTGISCEGLTPEECSNAGEHTYRATSFLDFNGCETVRDERQESKNFIFKTDGMTLSGPNAEFQFVKQSPNIYDLIMPNGSFIDEQQISTRYTFTTEGYLEDNLWQGQACLQRTWVRVAP